MRQVSLFGHQHVATPGMGPEQPNGLLLTALPVFPLKEAHFQHPLACMQMSHLAKTTFVPSLFAGVSVERVTIACSVTAPKPSLARKTRLLGRLTHVLQAELRLPQRFVLLLGSEQAGSAARTRSHPRPSTAVRARRSAHEPSPRARKGCPLGCCRVA